MKPSSGVSEDEFSRFLWTLDLTGRDKLDRPAIGLVLLLLKDLFLGQLPLGGEVSVGRGAFRGATADVKLFEGGSSKTWAIESIDAADALRVVEGDPTELQSYVESLFEESVT